MFVQDYIRFSYDDNVFSIKAFPPKGKIETPALEAEKSAFYYYKKYKNKKIILCLSGGLDSEVMAESFLRADVPFSASIWKYKTNLNMYDIKHAIKFCRQNKIDYEVEECDLESFYSNYHHFYYGIKYLCDSPQVVVHLYLLEKLSKRPGIALFLPWEPPSFYYTYTQNIRKIALRVIVAFRYLGYHRCFHLNKVSGSPYFIISRSALLYSFLKLPLVKSIMSQKNIEVLRLISPYKLKTIMYRQGGFLSKPKKRKLTGFDYMKIALQTKYGTDYDKAFRYPLQRVISSPKRKDVYIYPIWET